MTNSGKWLEAIVWNEAGLIPVIAQDNSSGEVLMLAWMNREALLQTLELGEAVYWSRSRKAIWHKGATSGHYQRLNELRLDCDGDALLLKVEQIGGIACHTGRRRCFFNLLEDGRWVASEPLVALENPGGFRS